MHRAQRFLELLAEQAGKSLPATEVQELVAEAQEHLELGIEARLELGMSPEEAERDALQAFGAASEVTKEIRRREPRFDRGFTLSVVGILLFILWAMQLGPMGPIWFACLVVYAALHVAYIVTSFRVRRPQFSIFAVILLPLWAGTAVWLSTKEVTVLDLPNGYGSMSILRKEIAADIARSTAQAERAREVPGEMVAGYTRYVRGESDLAPGKASRFGVGFALRVKPEADRALGLANWQNALVNGGRMIGNIGDEQFQRAAAMEEAAKRPWWAEVPYQVVPAMQKIALDQILAMYVGGHLFFWSLGVWSRRRKADRLRGVSA